MYETLFHHLPIGVMVVDPRGVIRLANSAAAAIFGYAASELDGMAVEALVPDGARDGHPGLRAGFLRSRVARPMGEGRPLEGVRRDGTHVHVQVGLIPHPHEPDVIVTVLDVSERVRARQALAEAQAINKTGTWSFDLEADRVRWSPELFRIFRLPAAAQAPPYDTHHTLFTPESWARLEPAVADAASAGTPYELELELSVRDASGPLIAIARCEPQRDRDGRVVRLVGTFQDVTELARAQRQRDRLLERLSLAQDAARIGVWEWFVDTDTLIWDAAMYRIYGLPQGTVTYADWRKTVHPADVTRAEAHVQEVLGGRGSLNTEFRVHTPEGERHILAKARLHQDGAGGARRMVGINMDVSERWQAQRALLERTRQWDRFFEATSNMLWNWDFSEDRVVRSPAFQTALGYAADEIDTDIAWWVDRLHPEDRPRVLHAFEQAVETGANTTGYTYRLRRRDGEYASIQDRVFVMRDGEGRAYRALGAMKDVTEELRHEEAARRTNNLESLGLLAGGIAHDFNNQLAGIAALAQLTLLDITDVDEVRENARQIIQAVHAGTALTRQLLTFSKGGAPSRQTVALDALVREHASFALTGSSTRVTFAFEEGLPHADVDPGQIGQVVHNLVINADQAMERGGVLHIALRSAEGDPHALELRVTDTGPGIPGDTIHRIFDPYFTTKATGHGLGLSICHSIVERHRGAIRVESAPGEGTTFVVRLPAAARAQSDPPRGAVVVPAHARVLVVDDLPEIQRVLSRLLRSLGYRADGVGSPAEAAAAVAEARAGDDPYAVVITDLTIPGSAGGRDVLRLVKEVDPSLKVVVASGYANDPILSDFGAYGFDGTLAKPIMMDELTTVIGSLLAG